MIRTYSSLSDKELAEYGCISDDGLTRELASRLLDVLAAKELENRAKMPYPKNPLPQFDTKKKNPLAFD